MNIGVIGTAGEECARIFLEKKGYEIECTNFQTRFGEIDIICKNDNYMVFAEVKTRSAGYMVSGRDSVGYAKQSRIVKAALQYIQLHKVKLQPRFDVIEVIINGEDVQIEHIENAFAGGGRHEFF